MELKSFSFAPERFEALEAKITDFTLILIFIRFHNYDER
jgi:hypothetical protein